MDKVLNIWNNLKTRYSQRDISWVSDLQMETSTLSQGNLLSLNNLPKSKLFEMNYTTLGLTLFACVLLSVILLFPKESRRIKPCNFFVV